MPDGFDVDAARKAGYSDDEILQHLSASRNFDVAGATRSGYSKQDVIKYLSSAPARSNAPDELTRQTNAAAQAAGVSNAGRAPIAPVDVRGVASLVPADMYLRARQEREGKIAPLPRPLGQPIAPMMGLSVPAFLKTLAGGYAGSKAGEYGGEALGLSPTASAWARDIGGLIGAGLPSLGRGLRTAGEKASQAAYTPEGELSPGLNALLHPTKIPEYLFRKVIPRPTELPSLGTGAPLPSAGEFYENRAADLARRPDELAQAVREGRAAKLPTRVRVAAPERPAMSAFSGLPSSALGDIRALATTSEPAPLAERPLPGPGTTTLSERPSVTFVREFKAPKPEASRIVSPESQAPHVEGSYWSFPQSALMRAVLEGDRDAAIVWRQRFGELPEGAKYLTDVGSQPLRGLYRGLK